MLVQQTLPPSHALGEHPAIEGGVVRVHLAEKHVNGADHRTEIWVEAARGHDALVCESQSRFTPAS
ncbi:hypothetical protein GCM10022247_40480 [Allokutzneria multivorans]|uniref:Uncharacterized protein n=1 Tax=Allokutzneria multivorans TaxID=1142134 RepID=A0ABP7SM95_9PSEU